MAGPRRALIQSSPAARSVSIRADVSIPPVADEDDPLEAEADPQPFERRGHGGGVARPGQTVPPAEAEYYYPDDQGARLEWYHDHVFGLTRLNAYAGMASGHVIYDDY